MRLYEGMFLVDNSEARKDYEKVSQNVAGIIQKHGGEIKQSERWAERRLAYPVKRRDRGTYILVYFNAPPEAIDQIRRDCVIDEVILRNMILKAVSIPEKKSEPVTAKEPAESKETAAKPVAEKGSPAPEPASAKPEAPPEPAQEVAVEPVQEVAAEPEQEVAAEPVQEVAAEPVQEVAAEPEQEVAAEPEQEVAVEPAQEVAPEPVQEAPEAPEAQDQDGKEEPVAVTGDEPADK